LRLIATPLRHSRLPGTLATPLTTFYTHSGASKSRKQGGDERGRELRQGESHVINDAIEGVGEREKAPWPVGFDEAESVAVLRPAAPAPSPVSAQAPHLSGTVRRMAALTKLSSSSSSLAHATATQGLGTVQRLSTTRLC